MQGKMHVSMFSYTLSWFQNLKKCPMDILNPFPNFWETFPEMEKGNDFTKKLFPCFLKIKNQKSKIKTNIINEKHYLES